MKKCVFAGTFDPVTKGHEEIIKKCADLFDETVVALCINVKKQAMFPVEKRLEFLRVVCKKYRGVKVVYLDTLTRGDYSADSYLEGMKSNIEQLKEAFQ